MSWLDELDTGDPRRLYRKYRNYGVLDEPQVLDSAKPSGPSGHPAATALLFSQTEMFPGTSSDSTSTRAVREYECKWIFHNNSEDR